MVRKGVPEKISLPPGNKPSLRKVESGVRNFYEAELDGSNLEENT